MHVSQAKQQALQHKLQALGIRRDAVVEKFICASGPGGQKVNKAATCVYVKHLPTGIEVKCQQSRSQNLNRFLAWRTLAEKIEAQRYGRSSTHARRIAKIKKQKQKRRKRALRKVRSQGGQSTSK